MFTTHPTYSPYRAIKYDPQKPMVHGEDVYAIQAGLIACGYDVPGGADGYFGKNSRAAVIGFQKDHDVQGGADGIPGQMTQRAIATELIKDEEVSLGLRKNILFGQCAHESSFILGNYTPVYIDGSWDSGPVQENSRHYPVMRSFMTPDALHDCGAHCKQYYVKFAGVKDDDRRWGLAAGAWNRPAYACYLARKEGAKGVKANETAVPDKVALERFEAYIDSVTAYI